MTVNINARLDQMLETDGQTGMVQEVMPPIPDEEPVGDERPIQVAGKGAVIKEILAPLLKKGARATETPTITRGQATPAQPVAPQPAAPGPTSPQPTGAAPAPATPAAPARPAITPVSEGSMQRTVTEQQSRIGQPPQAPSPTPGQVRAGVEEGPINTLPYDNDQMRATVSALADRVAVTNPTMTVRQIYQQAIDTGVPERVARRLFDGLDMNSGVGGNELAKNMAGLLKLHDESAAELDDLMSQLVAGALDDNGKLLLRERLAVHDLIVKQLRVAQVDVARTMNVFKRVRDKGPALAKIEMNDIMGAVGNDAELARLAEAYMQLPDRAGRNRVIEAGLGSKLRDVWFYVWQSNLLTDPVTHVYNAVSGGIHLGLSVTEQTLAAGVGRVRQALGGQAERYHMSDVLAGLTAFRNGTGDAIVLAGRALKTGETARAKGDAKLNPFTVENLSDTPVRLFGREIARTPDLTNTWVGKTIDALGFMHSLSFRALAAGDEVIGGLASRYQLHQDAWIYGRHEYDNLIASGMSHDDALAQVQKSVGSFLTERPASMQGNIEDFRSMVTLQTVFDDVLPLVDKYAAANRFVQNPLIKPFVPFSKTITNLFIEGSARTPLLNFVSPRFYSEYMRGGKHTDLALARIALGGSIGVSATWSATEGRVTGSGPSDLADLKALEGTGWQRYSFVFDKDELSPETIARLGELTTTSFSGDKVYVSYARFDPISQIFALGADMSDAVKFNNESIDSDDMAELALIYVGATSEYISNLPLMTGIGEMMQILRSRTEDNGDTLLRWFDGFAKQYSDVLITGTPGVGFANSTVVAHIERLVDPTKRSTMADVMDAPYGLRAFYQARQRLLSRMPYYSKDVVPDLDSLGREVLANTRGADFWLNYIPIVVAKQSKLSPADEVLVAFNHGVSMPSKQFDGVPLSATQYNRYKRLYGQEIKLPISYKTDASGAPKEINLEEAIAEIGVQARMKYEDKYGHFEIGDAQREIDAVVSLYRRRAKERMIGVWNDDDRAFDDSEEYGAPEFPELRQAITFKKSETVLKGK